MKFVEIKGHPRYEINESGVIRNRKTKSIKSQYIGSTGYFMVSFSYKNKVKPQRVHRLLSETFIENIYKKKFVNHKDGNKLNNNLENLEWCTHAENMKHAFMTGLADNTGQNNGQSKLNTEKVKEIKTLLKCGNLSQYKIAEMFGVSRSCISGIKLGRLWGHV